MTNAAGVADVAVIGLGYIGLPTAAVLARAGLDVVGVDRLRERVEAVNRGELPFLEDGLATVLAEQVGAGRLRAQTVTPSARTYVIAVPTPLTREGNTADLSLVEAATRQIAPCLTGDELIVLESTCPPGTTRALAEALISMRPDLSLDGSGGRRRVHVAHCPERVLPGRIMTEMVTNSRVIGGLTPEASHLARDLYATFCRGELVLTDATTAEMTKLTENSFRDLNIAFANELALVCDRAGVDVWELIDLANRHPRVSILHRARGGWPLHRRGPMVPGLLRARGDQAHPHGSPGQRLPARLLRRAHPSGAGRTGLADCGGARPDLQGRRRRSASVARTRDYRAGGRRRAPRPGPGG
ncbi:nucleotide sugar dehydrogenase [Actinomyces naeslundii str. Howell 279]|uniref:Nucleotide sugar dehydrogenase n=1 Tax=Actinomyces naeslundii (strain ATCC 12104 / DSM 43013 / CCUG 2238 / JCM 8349 / NCTC 10301 / Howell 279) TaxID=1115803 RepID=J3JIX7_ACTNH|nr:nucleotide sugar dehydrogenase [Actinomyces naeslundii str. Howell 279]